MPFNPNRLLTVTAGICLLIGASKPSAHAEDWPRWRGPDQTGISLETGLLKEWPTDGPKQVWKKALSGGFSSVVVAEGKLFTQTKERNQEVVLCLDAATGKEIWQLPI